MTDDVLFRALVEQSRDHAIFLIDSGGHNLTWGVGVERLLGYTRDQFIGRHTREIFTTEDQQAGVPERELAFAAAHGAASDERWLERKDGTRFWASGMTYRLQDAAEQLTGFAKIFRDLTVEREFEADLRARAERYRLASRAADEALWDRDLNTDTVTWTDGFEEVFGYGPAQLGKDVRWWEQRIHPDDRTRVTESLRRAVKGIAERWEEEYRFRRCDGEYVRVRDRARIMRTTDGLPLRMLGAMADVSRQRQSEEALRQSQQLAALGRLAGGVAHDLNNMLMAIIGYTEMLDRGFPGGDPRHRDTAEVLGAARRSADLTRKLLAFAQREVTRPTRLDVNQLIAGAAGRLRTVVGPTVELRLQLGSELPQVDADAAQLEQVLTDLAVNGRDAMAGSGRLTISTSERRLDDGAVSEQYAGSGMPAGRYVMVSVEDSGEGISPDVLQHVFEPFFTTRPFGKGVGLGLAAVYGSVRQNGGYIRAASEPGKGARFEILLPSAGDRDTVGGSPAE
ncbi:MAG TPA: PAS domain S-box protein [Gemmatimonadales bacterium]|nr:PAS domain S-box protein [Gemmatimonadales bacterium]